MQLGAGAAVAPGVIIHFVLGGLFAYFLLKARKGSPLDHRFPTPDD
jgi:hypothetical protein